MCAFDHLRDASNWNGVQLAKFLSIGEAIAMKEYKLRIDTLSLSAEQKEMVLGALNSATETIAEKLVIIALEYGHLKVENLRKLGAIDKPAKLPTRSLILEKEP